MNIVIDGTSYAAAFDDNDTARDIAALAPIDMTMTRFDGHEYYADMPQRPRTSGAAQTSHLDAGHLYYWAAGNAFVINFKEYE